MKPKKSNCLGTVKRLFEAFSEHIGFFSSWTNPKYAQHTFTYIYTGKT